MSIKSKGRPGSNGKNSDGPTDGDEQPDTGVEPHADLRDTAGNLLGGIVRRDGEWLLGMDGKMVGSSDSAATMLALIRRAKSMHERAGTSATLKSSDALRDAARNEAQQLGLEFDQFEARLEETMKTEGSTTGSGSPDHEGGTLH